MALIFSFILLVALVASVVVDVVSNIKAEREMKQMRKDHEIFLQRCRDAKEANRSKIN